MTKDEVKNMMKYFQSAYKGFYEGADTRDVLNVWYDAFKDEDKHYVAIASRNYVQANEYPPTIAGIMKQLSLIKDQETDTDLWAKIKKAISNGIYNSVEEFEQLPEPCKSFIGNPQTLKDLAQSEIGTVDTVVKGQFLKNVEAIKEHQNVQNGLPLEIKMAIANSKMNLLEGEYE